MENEIMRMVNENGTTNAMGKKWSEGREGLFEEESDQ